MAYKLISLSIRAGLAGGFVYWTREEGLWGDAKKSTDAYQKAKMNVNNLLGEANIQVPISVPKPTELGVFLHVNWNKAVYALFNGIQATPGKLCEWGKKGWDSASKLLDDPQPVKEVA